MTTETRTLDEIIQAVERGEKPTHDECYWAMLALEELLGAARKDLDDLEGKKADIEEILADIKDILAREFSRERQAFRKPPRVWLNSVDPVKRWTS